MEGRKDLLLAFGPHPDDVELNIGGIVALHALQHQAVIVDLTEGEMASNGTLAERRAESAEAATLLGVERVTLKLPDGGLNPHDTEQERAVVRVIRHFRPQIVLLPYWQDRHPDHVAASELIERAIFKSGLKLYQTEGLIPYRPLHWYYYLQHEHGTPDLIVDISQVYELKLKAIQAYASQFGGEKFATYISHPAFLQKIRARDEYFGAMIGARYGEGLISKLPLAVPDLFTFL